MYFSKFIIMNLKEHSSFNIDSFFFLSFFLRLRKDKFNITWDERALMKGKASQLTLDNTMYICHFIFSFMVN